MENKEIRRANLALLLEQHGTLVALANATGSNERHLSQLKNGSRQMGDEVARRIEEQLGLGRGWMDVNHAAPADLPEDERELLADYRRGSPAWKRWLRAAARLPASAQEAYLRAVPIAGAHTAVHEPLPPGYTEPRIPRAEKKTRRSG